MDFMSLMKQANQNRANATEKMISIDGNESLRKRNHHYRSDEPIRTKKMKSSTNEHTHQLNAIKGNSKMIPNLTQHLIGNNTDLTSNKKTKHQSTISSEQILRYRAKQERLKAEQNADGRKQLNVSIDRRMAIGTDKKVDKIDNNRQIVSNTTNVKYREEQHRKKKEESSAMMRMNKSKIDTNSRHHKQSSSSSISRSSDIAKSKSSLSSTKQPPTNISIRSDKKGDKTSSAPSTPQKLISSASSSTNKKSSTIIRKPTVDFSSLMAVAAKNDEKLRRNGLPLPPPPINKSAVISHKTPPPYRDRIGVSAGRLLTYAKTGSIDKKSKIDKQMMRNGGDKNSSKSGRQQQQQQDLPTSGRQQQQQQPSTSRISSDTTKQQRYLPGDIRAGTSNAAIVSKEKRYLPGDMRYCGGPAKAPPESFVKKPTIPPPVQGQLQPTSSTNRNINNDNRLGRGASNSSREQLRAKELQRRRLGAPIVIPAEESDDDDDSLDSFIDDDDDIDYNQLQREKEEALKGINRNMDRSEWKRREAMIDDRSMETSYRQLAAEEKRSAHLGLREDVDEWKKGRSRALS